LKLGKLIPDSQVQRLALEVANGRESSSAWKEGDRMWIRQLSALVVVIGLIAGHSTARAENYDVSALRYRNDGGYYACIGLRWIDKSGNLHKYNTGICTSNGDVFEIYPDKGGAEEGNEVWLIINIKSGDTESCRKTNTKFFYKDGAKGARFETSGTTLHNNRCRIICRQCKTSR
jgi:hypothetical protein